MTEAEKMILEKLTELSGGLAEVNTKVETLSTKMTKVQITIENDLSRKIDIIGEGHDFLKQRLNEALQMETKRESMELELVNLKMELKK